MPPKGANTKKESGRAKKAENEAKKAEAAAAAKASTCSFDLSNKLIEIYRRVKKLKHGPTKTPKVAKPKKKLRKKNGKPISLEKLRTRNCSLKKRHRFKQQRRNLRDRRRRLHLSHLGLAQLLQKEISDR